MLYIFFCKVFHQKKLKQNPEQQQQLKQQIWITKNTLNNSNNKNNIMKQKNVKKLKQKYIRINTSWDDRIKYKGFFFHKKKNKNKNIFISFISFNRFHLWVLNKNTHAHQQQHVCVFNFIQFWGWWRFKRK